MNRNNAISIAKTTRIFGGIASSIGQPKGQRIGHQPLLDKCVNRASNISSELGVEGCSSMTHKYSKIRGIFNELVHSYVDLTPLHAEYKKYAQKHGIEGLIS